ncbi:histone chaperone asf1 [Anopheles stephensi]|uniref:histone chaperone asf1 n=1 Tax=Anopheles stephensi TaxID=30069 RepID=UPI001658851F|nr:histone chaperone asf1 [Anopheles stephensi]
MAKVHITNVVVLDNPSSFLNPFQFELTFECIEELKEDLEWKMIYVGSAESEEFDQVLDTIYVGPVPEGRHIFVFQADPPNVTRIPEQDAVGVTVVLLTCSYRGQEFVRVGYFINNEYADAEMRENPPPRPLFHKMTRNILASKPRVTRFKINWDDAPVNGVAGGPSNGMMDGEEAPTDEMATNGDAGEDHGMDGESMNSGPSHHHHPADLGHDDNSIAMPATEMPEFNENSNSLAMEC